MHLYVSYKERFKSIAQEKMKVSATQRRFAPVLLLLLIPILWLFIMHTRTRGPAAEIVKAPRSRPLLFSMIQHAVERSIPLGNAGAMHFSHLGLFGGRGEAALNIVDLLPELLNSRNYERHPTNCGGNAEGSGYLLPPVLFAQTVPPVLVGQRPQTIVQRLGIDAIVTEQFLLDEYFSVLNLSSENEISDTKKRFEWWKAKERGENSGLVGLSWLDVRAAINRAQRDVSLQFISRGLEHPAAAVTSAGISVCESYVPLKELKKVERIAVNQEVVEEAKNARGIRGLLPNMLAAQFGYGSQVEQAALLRKVEVWSPLCTLRSAPVPRGKIKMHSMAVVAVRRPTVLCVTMTTCERIKMALLQHQLWGWLCDEFLMFVTDGSRGKTSAERDEFDEKVKQATFHSGPADGPLRGVPRPINPTTQIIFVKPTFGQGAAVGAEDDAQTPNFSIDLDAPAPEIHAAAHAPKNRWQKIREVFNFLESWPSRIDFDFVYFSGDDTYMIPENLDMMLAVEPELSMLHQLGTPLYFGNRMVVPDGNIPYVASAPGFVLNSVALKLMYQVFGSAGCFPTAIAESEDVLLAQCLDEFAILARDTSDEIGEDRFVALSPEWIVKTAVNPGSSWWYPFYRPRPMPGAPFAPTDDSKSSRFVPRSLEEVIELSIHGMSSSAIAFGYVRTPQQALWLHDRLFGTSIP